MSDSTDLQALDILGTYLTSSPVAPLTKEFVEIESPLWYGFFSLCMYANVRYSPSFHSTYIYFGEDTRATYVDLPVYVGSVPVEYIDTFDEKLKASLQRVVDEGIDMKRMAMVINRDERQVILDFPN